MRALRVVGVTGDGSVVLEDPGRRERYTVPADEQLRAAARGDVTRLGQIAIELESQLRPREIQARIRGGASVEQVAEAAGVPVQKIERFAYPVLLERSRTAELAQGAHPQRADGPDVRTLGETVAHTFGLRGHDFTATAWDSWKGDDGRWVVALTWRAGRSDNAAHWSFLPGAHGGTVTALDEHAHDLVEGLPARPLRTVGPVIEIGRDDEQPGTDDPETTTQVRAAAAGESRTASPADSRRGIAPEQRRSSPSSNPQTPRTRESATAAPAPAAPATEPEPSAPAPSAAESPAAATTRAADTPPTSGPAEKPTPGTPRPETTGAETTGAQAAGSGTTGSQAAGSGTTGSRTTPPEPPTAGTAGSSTPDGDREVPGDPADVPEPEQATADTGVTDSGRPEDGEQTEQTEDGEPAKPRGPAGARTATTNRRTKKGKPVMPSWDEVLLGVRGQR